MPTRTQPTSSSTRPTPPSLSPEPPAEPGATAAPAPTWPGLISQLIDGTDLGRDQARWAMDEVMSGNASPVALAGFLVALRAKGESVQELTGLADGMLGHALPVCLPGPALDIVGTGGDRAFTVNISTMASLVIVAAGVPVVKHGNRASSSKSGSADVLEALGVRLDLPVGRVEAIYRDLGIAFLFAQVFHPSMRYAAVARRELGVATIFNFLGPITNPAQPTAAAIGCADEDMAPVIAGVLAGRGVDALVFRGMTDGLDELAATGPSQLWEARGGHVADHVIDAHTDLGLDRITLADIRGRDAAYNAGVARRFLSGEPGPVRQTVLLNAAAGLVADGRLIDPACDCLTGRLRRGLEIAARAVDSGRALDLLDRWVQATNTQDRTTRHDNRK